MREISILIKPASSLCNANCAYCFYEDVSTNREIKSYGFMQKKTAEKIVDEAFNIMPSYDRINFVFQGGEPLLAGSEFYLEFISYTQEHKNNILVEYSMQTNGTLLNDELCTLFKKYNFLIGISIDGFKKSHNKHRFLNRNGSFDKVMEGVDLLRKHKINFNVLTVLTDYLSNYPNELFQFYKDNEFNVVQIIPCLPDFNQKPVESPYYLTPKQFYSFYSNFFDIWLNELKQGNYISESLIDNVVNTVLGLPVNRCGMFGACQLHHIFESDGSMYPCDFYVIDKFKLGNILDLGLKQINLNPLVEDFKNYDNKLEDVCINCEFKLICNGNCKRTRPTFLSKDYCGYKGLIEQVMSNIDLIVDSINRINIK